MGTTNADALIKAYLDSVTIPYGPYLTDVVTEALPAGFRKLMQIVFGILVDFVAHAWPTSRLTVQLKLNLALTKLTDFSLAHRLLTKSSIYFNICPPNTHLLAIRLFTENLAEIRS